MPRTLHGTLALALATTLLSGCYVYRQPVDPADLPPPPPEGEGPPGEPGQPPQPGAQVAEQQPEAPPAPPPRRRRMAPRPDVAPRVTAPTAFGDGNGGVFRGLIYLMPDDADRLPDFSHLQPIGEVFTDRFDVRPQEFHGGFPGVSKEEEWFAIRYEGPINLPEGGVWRFRLVSDDGSVLSIDNVKIIENDGVHGARALRGAATLSPGRHNLKLDYFQGNKGPVALQLYASPPSAPAAEFVLQGSAH